MMRLFVAVPLPAPVRAELAGLQGGVPGARWVAAENLHLSLRFIGNVDRGQAEDIDALLADIRWPGFELRLSGVGGFGPGERVQVIWAGVERCDLLAGLRDKVESAVVRAGLAPEGRKFKAHVTLARLKNGRGARIGAFMESHNRFSAGPFDVDHFVLFRSHLSREGAHYEELATYPLTTYPRDEMADFSSQTG